MPLAVALFSGGLDSSLAVRIVQRLGWQVHALHVETPLACSRQAAGLAAEELGVPLTVVSAGDDYFDILRRPRFGYGRGANPCVDCRTYMAGLARRMMAETGADLVISGEVLGQRPMSQKRRDLETIEYHAGLERQLLRPLSARLLSPTLAEQDGRIDREALFAFSGQSRKPQLALARQFGLTAAASPTGGCPLAEPSFAPRVVDLKNQPHAGRWDWELLRHGRHFRLDAVTKAVVGRNAEDNAALRRFAADADRSPCVLLSPVDFPGPDVLLVGPETPATLAVAGQLLARYARLAPGPFRICAVQATGRRELTLDADSDAELPSAL